MQDEQTTDTASPPDAPDEEALRRRLINRIALAGVAVVALLGGLAVIDTMYVAPPANPPRKETPAALPIEEPVKSGEQAAEAPPTPPTSAPNKAEAAPSNEPMPEPPKPEAVPSIKSSGEPEETYSPSVPLPKEPRVKVPVPEKKTPAPAQELAHQEPAAPVVPTTAPPRPLTQGNVPERRFVLQLGVFNNVENAQDLLFKLQKGGVPAQIEARVQVGPFNTKEEAEAARAKLKALGMDSGLLMSIHR